MLLGRAVVRPFPLPCNFPRRNIFICQVYCGWAAELFPFGAVMGSAAVNVLAHVLWRTCVWISVRCRPRNGIAESEEMYVFSTH